MANQQHEVSPQRLLRRNQVQQSIGLSRSAIYSKLDEDSPYYDPNFPKPIHLGARSIAWIEQEIQEYIQFCATHSRAPSKSKSIVSPKFNGGTK